MTLNLDRIERDAREGSADPATTLALIGEVRRLRELMAHFDEAVDEILRSRPHFEAGKTYTVSFELPIDGKHLEEMRQALGDTNDPKS
ncbi:hypothetical protein [Ponticaulis profundi]|uniref:Uncharacterized protein n=1 Tax=Ponticaulis profundi TaxID=2665222 RepID=A0ABW1S8M2_9PROT